MTVSVESFLDGNPEFAKTPVGLVNAKLQEALIEVDPVTWGKFTDTGVSYLTAHKLALSPFGQNARMIAKDGRTTTYLGHYMRLVGIVAVGGIVP